MKSESRISVSKMS